ncbi:MAG: SMEK domain-containing protein, partial [Glaciecola sp.]
MDVLTVENELRDVVSRLISQVELASKQGRLDINLAMEDAFIPILKELFHLQRLHNLNAKQKNFPGIDLGDEFDRVAFQVTATTDLEKVKKTLTIFMDKNYQSNFDELFILMLVNKQKSYSQQAIDKITGTDFSFNTKTHIIDCADILARVTSLRVTAQKRILHEFKLILGDIDGYLALREPKANNSGVFTTNLAPIAFPETVFVAQTTIVKKDVLSRAKSELEYKGRKSDMQLCIRLALALEGSNFTGWAFHDGKIFSFTDFNQHGA